MGRDIIAFAVGIGLPDVSYHGENAWQAPAEVHSRQLGVLYCAAGEQEDLCFIASLGSLVKPAPHPELRPCIL